MTGAAGRACDGPAPATTPEHLPEQAFAQAVEALEAGRPVIFPTDTVYGIGVSVKHAPSPRVLFDLKLRDAGKPVAWLVGSASALDEFGADVPASARQLAQEHWPGALTIIVRANEAAPPAFVSDAGTVGLRMPASGTALALIEAIGCPIATTSANISGEPAPRTYAEIDGRLKDGATALAGDEQAASGTASTVIDCSQGTLKVVRRGTLDLG